MQLTTVSFKKNVDKYLGKRFVFQTTDLFVYIQPLYT